MERQICLCIVTVAIMMVLYPHGCTSYVPSPSDFLTVRVLNSKVLLEEFMKDPNLRAVYYFKRDLPRLRAFLKELDKSAENLKVYGVEVALFDCTTSTDEETCKKDKVEQMIYTYRNGQKLLQLELETMFDVNSIMSNILQLVLLREVPILQRQEERNQYVDRHRGKFDTIFGYMRAIGTYEHRVFMEVAYAYQDKYKFALCTNKEGYSGLEGENEVAEQTTAWVIYSKGTTEMISSPSLRLKCPVNLVTLASFVKALTLPKTYDVPVSGAEIPYQSKDMHIAYLYYDGDTEKNVKENADRLAQDFHGTVGIVTIERNAAIQQFTSHGYDGRSPRISFQMKDTTNPVFPPPELWNPQEINMFVKASVAEYCRKNPGPVNPSGEMNGEETAERGTAVSPDINVDEVETQDDEVAGEVIRLNKVPMKLDLVPALTDKTFPQNIGSTNLLLVLFYLPFDARSMSFLRRYGEAAVMLRDQSTKSLARVNCYDWTDVCGNQNVTIYPTLRVYQKMGEVHEDYKGPMDTQAVYSTVKLLQYSRPLPLTIQSEIDGFVSGTFPPDMSTISNTSIMGLFGKSHAQEQAVYDQLAEEMKDKFVFGLVDSAFAPKMANMYGTDLPAVVVLKRDDMLEPHVVYRGMYQAQVLKDFILMNSLPKLVELTPQRFPLLYGQQKPFVILFTNGGDKSKLSEKAIEQVIQTNKYRDLMFCYLSVPSKSSLGHRVLQQYNSNLDIPTISLVKLNTVSAKVYNLFDGYKYESDKISEWIGHVLAGQEQLSSMLPRGDWKPLSKGYNFLKIIEWEKKHANKRETNQILATAEEHGIGFNADGEYEKEEVSSRMHKEDHMGMMKETDSKEDAEVREELVQLHSSRLYHQKHVKEHNKEGKMDKMKTDRKSESQTPKDQIKHEEL
ncbi:hypothetical protein CHS0354_031088 [Potamilus streckersoni]|uniref:Thioredoxin domain-containing protein n=1 Tax=Potamilus streckersoni TaxID=2493646 RepID=A0AAE0VMV5_9BIVA|nr:hypothetical protein CHS0354_031088 [Potamilus streckersoni]